MIVLDNGVKNAVDDDLSYLANANAGYFVPFTAVKGHGPWNGCKFVSTVVLHLVSGTDVTSKKDAVRPLSYSLGGCKIPSDTVLSATRWPYVLSESFSKASLAAQTARKCTALRIQISDVEIMRNPRKKGSIFAVRPGTFAHSFILTVTPVGVYLFQGYGPRGYTLLQHIEKHDKSYPLSLTEGEAWVKIFEQITAERSGTWTKEVNEAYAHCFGVDLVAIGNMRIGSQLDAYVEVQAHEFDIRLVKQNFGLLPMKDASKKPLCRDGILAKTGDFHNSKAPDGGVMHYYVPVVLRCGFCGGSHTKASKRCAACKRVYYCNKDCQTKDWKLRHKKVCNALAREC